MNLPSGWSTPSGGGLNLVTHDQVDALGRTTKETSPGGNITYMRLPRSAARGAHLQRLEQHDEHADRPDGSDPHDAFDGYDEVFTMTATPHLTNGAPTAPKPSAVCKL